MMLSITVTSNFDGAAQSQQTTLIGAILAADNISGGATIILPADTTFTVSGSGYTAPLTGNGNVNTGITLLPGISQPITIEGNGSSIVLAPGAVGRFFSITSGLTLDNVNLIGGAEQGGAGGGGFTGGGGGAGLGGAIFVNGSSATLTLNQASIANSSATGGAGASYDYLTNAGLPGDEGAGGGGGLGGQGADHSGSNDGIAGGGGGGPLNYSATTNSTTGADGVGGTGGTSSGVSGTAGGFGGGGGGGAGGTYVNSNNLIAGSGGAGGFGGGGGGGGYSTPGRLAFGAAGGFGGGGGASGYGVSGGAGGAFGGTGGNGTNNNQVGGGGAGLGGAIFNYQGTVNLNNVSLLDNSATGGGGNASGTGAGGALFNYSGSVTLNSATIASNSATTSGAGGGIYNYKASGGAAPTVSLFNSALANNVDYASSGGSAIANDILNGSGGTITANGTNHNFIGASSGAVTGTVRSGSAFLSFPGIYGGYIAAPPGLGSPLTGAGDPTTSLGVDETGAVRSGTAPTIGAYEGALPSPFPLASGSIVVSESSLGALFDIDPSTGNRQAISAANIIGTGAALINPSAVAIDSNGTIYVVAGSAVGNDDEIYKVDPTNGDRTLLSGNGTGSGTAFGVITDITYDSATSSLLVTDSSAQAVYSVNTGTGNRTLLSNNTTPNGANSFVAPTSIVYNSTAGIVEGDVGFDSSTFDSGLLKIAGNGARTILSDDIHPNTTNQIGQVAGIANSSNGSILAIDQFSDPSGSSSPTVLDSVATTGTPGARTLIATFPATDSSSNTLSEYGVAAGSSAIYVTQTGTSSADNQVLQVSGSNVTQLAGNTIGSGPFFGTGLNIGIAMVPATAPAAPTVTTNPSSATMNSSGSTSFTSAATGSPTPTEQWQISTDGGATFNNLTNTGVYSGATSATLTITGGTTALNGDEYRDVFTNTPGTANTTAATLTVDFAPAIASSPINQTVNASGNTSFTATANGLPVPTVQWQVSTNGGATFSNITNGGVYSGATTNTLTITGATAPMNAYEYQAIYSNTLFGAGSSSTAPTTAATLTVDSAPGISSSPSNATVSAAGDISFSAAGTGTPAPAAQWEVSTDGGVTFNNVSNGGVYSGATSNTLNITGALAAMNAYKYKAVYSNTLLGAGSVSTATTNPATLTVDFAPAVTTNPNDSTIGTGTNTSFAVAATGNPTPTVQWQLSSDGGATFNDLANSGIYSGVTTDTLTLTGATLAENGYEYQAVFSNRLFGSDFPSTTTSTVATLTIEAAPVIGVSPTDGTINASGNLSFVSSATGNPTPTEQWQVSTDGGATFNNIADGGVYSGTTSATLTITGGTAAMNGYEYRDVFTNGNGTATTDPSTLTVDFAPTVTTNPNDSTIGTGTNTSFTVDATGNPTPTVQWQVSTDGGNTFSNLASTGIYSGVTTGTLTLTGATLTENSYEYQAVFSNTLFGAGSSSIATTTAATLSISAAPVIGVNPTGATINAGGNTSFVSSATGSPTPTAQWQVSTDGGDTYNNITDGGVYSGAATSTLSITGGAAAMNGYEYRDVLTNGSGSATTNPGTLTVDFAPTVTTNPTSGTVNTGSTTSFTVAATGNPTPTVKWQVSTDGGNTFNSITNTGIYSGVTTDTLTLTGATLTQNGFEYHAVFSNRPVGSDIPRTAMTTAATLNVSAVPVVGVNPISSTINAGGDTSFASSATGSPTPTEQWQVSTDGGVTFNNITDGGVYSGSTSATLLITGGTAAMNGYEYRDVFTNGNGTATTDPSTLTVDFVPTVTTNPSNSTIGAGATTSLTVAATGNPTPTVQWQLSTDGGATFNNLANTGIYSGVTTNTLTLTAATLTENGYEYRAVFTNSLLDAGSPSTATSTAATLTISDAPIVGVNPTGATINAGDNIAFTSAATGSPVPSEQWQVSTDGGATFNNLANTGVYSGATSARLTITGATAAMNGYEYRDVFTNGNGTANTDPSTLTVDFAPTVTTNPIDGTVDSGSTASFTAAATGNPATTVQWQLSTDGGATFNDLANTGIYSGVTTSTLNVTAATLTENSYEYRAVFSNTLLGAGSLSTATTTAATLTVGAPVITVSAFAQMISPTSDTATLHVLGEQDGSDENLIYTWSIISQPSAAVGRLAVGAGTGSPAPLATFSVNGTHSAKNTSVTFLTSGQYTFQVVASNGTQSVSSQVEVTVLVKPSAKRSTTQTLQVSGVQTVGDARSITGLVVSFNGPLDPTSAQNLLAYRFVGQRHINGNGQFIHAQNIFGESGSSTVFTPYAISSAVYDSQTNTVALTLASPMPLKAGIRQLRVMGTGPNAIRSAGGALLDGDANNKPGGNFAYSFSMQVSNSQSYRAANGDQVKLSLSGPGQIATLLPQGPGNPVIFLSDTDPLSSILTGTVQKGRKSSGPVVLDQLNGASQATIHLSDDFHVNVYGQ